MPQLKSFGRPPAESEKTAMKARAGEDLNLEFHSAEGRHWVAVTSDWCELDSNQTKDFFAWIDTRFKSLVNPPKLHKSIDIQIRRPMTTKEEKYFKYRFPDSVVFKDKIRFRYSDKDASSVDFGKIQNLLERWGSPNVGVGDGMFERLVKW